MSWTLDAGGRWCRHDSTGGHNAFVQRTADGARWFATVNGKPLHPAGRSTALLTWETADGARAHVERVLRRPIPGAVFAGRDCPRCGFIHCSCLRELRAGDPADLYGDLDDDDDGGER